jgi:hypothetical protein
MTNFKINSRANWASLNPVLNPGEPGLEEHINNLKIGDGKTAWNQLPYLRLAWILGQLLG